METAALVNAKPAEGYKMPQVFMGQEVIFYPYGDEDQNSFHLATVERIWPNGVKLRLTSGGVARTYSQCVRHARDPHFNTKPEAKRMDGCWDYTSYDKYIVARIERLEASLSNLTQVAISQMAEREAPFEPEQPVLDEAQSGDVDEVIVKRGPGGRPRKLPV